MGDTPARRPPLAWHFWDRAVFRKGHDGRSEETSSAVGEERIAGTQSAEIVLAGRTWTDHDMQLVSYIRPPV